jgi:Domain of unknown function (DUF4157)
MPLLNFPKLIQVVSVPGIFDGIARPFQGVEDEVGALGYPVAGLADLREAGLADLLPLLSRAALNPVAIAIVLSYFAFLERQGRDRFRSIPQPLRGRLQPFYRKSDLGEVLYAEGVNTLEQGVAVTVDRHVFFPVALDLGEPVNVRWLAHELQHCEQYADRGGRLPFLRDYLGQALDKVVANRSVNVHDVIELEQDAERVSDLVMAQLSLPPGA